MIKYCKFTAGCANERILKIGQILYEVVMKLGGLVFIDQWTISQKTEKRTSSLFVSYTRNVSLFALFPGHLRRCGQFNIRA